MKSKLTLRVDDGVVRRAKSYADGVGVELAPRVRRLLGALAHADVDEEDEEEDARDHRVQKHS